MPTDLTQLVTDLPQSISDLETEVQNAKYFAYGSLALLLYIAVQVSRRRR